MRFKIQNGLAAVYNEAVAGDAPLTSPMSYFDAVTWSNQFEHIGIIATKTYSVTLPKDVASHYPAWRKTFILGPHGQSIAPFVFGFVTLPNGKRRPFAMHALIDQATDAAALSGVPANSFTRKVSLGIDGGNIVLHAVATSSFWGNRPGGQSKTTPYPTVRIGVTVYITDLSLSRLQSPAAHVVNKSFVISANSVKLGPVDATRRWLRKATTGSQALLVNGPTMKALNPFNWRYKLPSTSVHTHEAKFGASAPSVVATAVDISL